MSHLVKALANLGYGSRREVTQLLTLKRVTDLVGRPLNSAATFVHDEVLVNGVPLDPPAGSVIRLHKPAGYVCSSRDQHNPTVYDLLPSRFRDRSPIMAPVGRLDLDTTGLLLVTDDGALNHRLTSPRSHLPKVYEATLAEPLREGALDLFASGTMLLNGESTPLAPVSTDVLELHRVRLTLTEGRYHQVRRMFAAVGNHVVHLARVAIGEITLGDQPEGSWRLVTEVERAALTLTSRAAGRQAP